MTRTWQPAWPRPPSDQQPHAAKRLNLLFNVTDQSMFASRLSWQRSAQSARPAKGTGGKLVNPGCIHQLHTQTASSPVSL